MPDQKPKPPIKYDEVSAVIPKRVELVGESKGKRPRRSID